MVCALGETMASFCPTILFRRLDLPVLGRPAIATVPPAVARGEYAAARNCYLKPPPDLPMCRS